MFHLLSSFETDASSEFVIIVAVDATSSIRRHHALFNVMFVCAFSAALFLLAESDHIIKFEASVTLSDVTVLFKQLT
jgi:hypothetical protein